MATKNAARIIKWDRELDTLEKGKRADLLVIGAQNEDDPYQTILNASKKSIALVVINGRPRYGDAKFMNKFEGVTETKKIGNKTKVFNLQQQTQDPVVGNLKLAQAESIMKKGLANIKKLAAGTPPLRGMTVAGDKEFFKKIQAQRNLPDYIKTGLPKMYGLI